VSAPAFSDDFMWRAAAPSQVRWRGAVGLVMADARVIAAGESVYVRFSAENRRSSSVRTLFISAGEARVVEYRLPVPLQPGDRKSLITRLPGIEPTVTAFALVEPEPGLIERD